MPEPSHHEASAVVAETGLGKLQGVVRWPMAALVVDEPASVGGLNSGPNPYDLLCAALATCTMMTLRLYADRKVWPVRRIRVSVRHHAPASGGRDLFERSIALEGELDDEQSERMLQIAERCPTHLPLTRGSDVRTALVSAGAEASPA